MTAKKQAKATQAVGSVWEVESKGRVQVTRPDGSLVQVDAADGVALHVLDLKGEYGTDDGQTVVAK